MGMPMYWANFFYKCKKVCENRHLVGFCDVFHAESEITDGAAEVALDQDVLGLEVPVSDGRLTLGADDGHVQVGQAGGYGERHGDELEGDESFLTRKT